MIPAVDSFLAARINVTGNSKAAPPDELRAIFLWPMLVPRPFTSLAEEGHPITLLILAHYCVLLHWAAEWCWCFEG